MAITKFKFGTFSLLFLTVQCFMLVEAHDHLLVPETTTNRSEETDGNFLLPLLKCTTDAECTLATTNSTRILPVCDNTLNQCKCPPTFNGLRVISLNGSCSLVHQIGTPCQNDTECMGRVTGSICSKDGICQCSHGEATLSVGKADWFESCPTEMPGSDQLNTFKWIFIFILVGYPILTGLFAIFEKEKDDHWFYEKIASVIDCRKNGPRRRVRNRRNTEDVFLSTEDDESPLEMEIV